MTDKAALYARVSTENQDLTDQVEKLESWAESEGVEYDLFKEKASSVKERPEFDALMDGLDEYDFVAITKLDRFGRSLKKMLANIDIVNEKTGGIVVIDDEFNIDTRGEETIQQRIIRDFLTLFADIERRMIRRRMEEGYKKALEEGEVGRPSALDDDDIDKLCAMYKSDRYSWNGLKKEFGVSKATISKALKDEGLLDE